MGCETAQGHSAGRLVRLGFEHQLSGSRVCTALLPTLCSGGTTEAWVKEVGPCPRSPSKPGGGTRRLESWSPGFSLRAGSGKAAPLGFPEPHR